MKENSLVEPETIFQIPYELDMKVELVRHASSHFVLKSPKVMLILDLASHTDKDIVAMLVRTFLQKFY